MSDIRETCDNKEICGRTGHVRAPDGSWSRCHCLNKEMEKRRLGPFFCDNPIKTSPVMTFIDRSCLFTGSLSSLRPHVAGVIQNLEAKGKSVRYMDAYRLIEIYLEKDPEFQTTSEGTEADLLIFLVGFGDPRNKYLPELLVQAIDRREILSKATWVILGIPLSQVAGKYNEQLYDKLNSLKKVEGSR